MLAWLAVAALMLATASPAFAVSKEMIQLQTQVQALQDQVSRMQQSIDMNMGVMKNLIEQSADSVNKMNAAVNDLQQQNAGPAQRQQWPHGSALRADPVAARLGGRAEVAAGQGQQAARRHAAGRAEPGRRPARHDGGFRRRSAGGTRRRRQCGASQAPPADVLYNNALRDYNSGKYDLASQEFGDYFKYYSNTDLAGNAQFYLADIEYRQGNFEAAVKDYDKVLEQYPGGNKAAAAQLKKGYALLELGQRDAGVRELNSLIARYPRSIEASQARDRLRRLGVTSGSRRRPQAAARKPPPRAAMTAIRSALRQSSAGRSLARASPPSCLAPEPARGPRRECEGRCLPNQIAAAIQATPPSATVHGAPR